jgi:hypothetical protein
MAYQVKLELPEEVRQKAEESAEQLGIPVEAVLIQWLKFMSMTQAPQPFNLAAEYYIETPYGNEAAAKILQDYLDAHRDKSVGKDE